MSMNRQVKSFLMPGVLCTVLLLTGCAGTALGEWNQKISDAAYSLAGGGKSGPAEGDMPWMARATGGPRQTAQRTYTLPVDVDTAAARLKSHYQFISSEELESLRQRNQYGDWSAAAIDESRPVWAANRGSYYKMGQEWKGHDRLELELLKSGAGSSLKVAYSSPDASHLTEAYLERLMTQLQQVAKGQLK
ncbi:hypothetical protein R3D73_004882 [Serratia marcescens]|nr:hypothetical protein [Serratia marcescens]ELQ9441992.1 hypothetical protein [Serratia marcescens]ELT5559620.1 hypothetical protein [Serratia marcescens]